VSQTVHEIRLDKTRRLAAQPGKGHNRWHPEIPVLKISSGDEAILDTLDALDCQIAPSSGIADVSG
jgi:formamidase